MILDGQTIGAILGFLGIVVTAICGVFVATRTNRTEKQDTARAALEQTKDEVLEARLTLKDETIAALKADKEELEADLAKAKKELDDCRRFSNIRIEELEAEIDRLELELPKSKGPDSGR